MHRFCENAPSKKRADSLRRKKQPNNSARSNNTDSTNFDQHYLHNLLGIDLDTKIIFYASDPSKDESQRYLTEKFLMESIREKLDYQLVIKNHPQDSAENYALCLLRFMQTEKTFH